MYRSDSLARCAITDAVSASLGSSLSNPERLHAAAREVRVCTQLHCRRGANGATRRDTMLVVTHLATPIAVATACEFSSCVTCAEKDMRPGEWRAVREVLEICTHFTANRQLL